MRLYSLKSLVAVLLLLATTCYCKTSFARDLSVSSGLCRDVLCRDELCREGQCLQSLPDTSGKNQDTSGQNKEIVINGKVIAGESSSPLEGVGILVKGTKNITGTLVDGTFALLIKPGDKVLVITAEGYKPQEIPITKATEYYVTLQPL
jgi:hypothetical protein